MRFWLWLLFLLLPAAGLGNELEECRRLAPKYGVIPENIEYPLWDSTRVDLLNEHLAIEVDWAPKYAEAIGQSMYYAILTGRRPAIILLVRDRERDRRYVYRCQTVCAKLDIVLFVEDVPPKVVPAPLPGPAPTPALEAKTD